LWDIMLCCPVKAVALEEHFASIFTVEEQARQETNMKELASRACCVDAILFIDKLNNI
jgi:hypothetical protein